MHQLIFSSKNPYEYRPVRELIALQSSIKYFGWDSEYDSQFDPHSIFFLLHSDAGDLLAGSRLILADDVHKIPSELASPSFLILDKRKTTVGEYSGFWFSSLKYGLTLACFASYWILANLQPIDIYTIFDKQNRAMKKVYLNLMQFQPVNHTSIAYKGFSYKDTRKTVEWFLAVDNSNQRYMRAHHIANIPAVKRIMPKVATCQYNIYTPENKRSANKGELAEDTVGTCN